MAGAAHSSTASTRLFAGAAFIKFCWAKALAWAGTGAGAGAGWH